MRDGEMHLYARGQTADAQVYLTVFSAVDFHIIRGNAYQTQGLGGSAPGGDAPSEMERGVGVSHAVIKIGLREKGKVEGRIRAGIGEAVNGDDFDSDSRDSHHGALMCSRIFRASSLKEMMERSG